MGAGESLRPAQTTDVLAAGRVVAEAFVHRLKRARVIKSSDRVSSGVHQTSVPRSLGAAKGIPILRYIPSLKHFDPPWDERPAMIAMVVGADRKPVTIHRTYLTLDGEKAPGVEPRGTMPGVETLPAGLAVRLAEHGDTLGVAEGIETAISASILFKVPVWSCLTAHFLKKWEPPAGLCRVIVFGDNDSTFTGHAAAYELARRLTVVRKIPDVEVSIYPMRGGDWNEPLAA